MRPQARFDLAKLDAKAADLDLEVVAAQKVDGAVGTPAAKIAGLVHPRIGFCRKRVFHEPLGRQLRPVQIAARNARAADVNLARHPDRRRLKVRVQNVDLRIRDRTTDRNAVAPRAPRCHLVQRAARPDRGFGRAVPFAHVWRRPAAPGRLRKVSGHTSSPLNSAMPFRPAQPACNQHDQMAEGVSHRTGNLSVALGSSHSTRPGSRHGLLIRHDRATPPPGQRADTLQTERRRTQGFAATQRYRSTSEFHASSTRPAARSPRDAIITPFGTPGRARRIHDIGCRFGSCRVLRGYLAGSLAQTVRIGLSVQGNQSCAALSAEQPWSRRDHKVVAPQSFTMKASRSAG